MPRFRVRPLVLAAWGLCSVPAQAASLTQLYERIPAPPADVASALAGSRGGVLNTPDYLALRQALGAERAAIVALAGGQPPTMEPVGALDPSEPAEVRQVATQFDAYLSDNSGKQEPSAALGKRTRWLQAAMGGNLAKVVARIQPCPEPCADAAVLAQNQAALESKAHLAAQDLAQFGALFADWTRSREPALSRGDAQIAATGEGARAQTAAGRLAVAKFRAALLREIEVALSITELAVKRAWAIDSGKVDAVSSSTRNAKAAK